MTIMQTVLESFTSRKADSEDAYRKLVLAVAGGKPLPKTAVDTAVAAGRSLADLEAAVARLVARQEAAEQLRQAESMQPEVEAAAKAVVSASEALHAVEEENRVRLDAAKGAAAAAAHHRRSLARRQDDLRRRSQETLLKTADHRVAERIGQLEAERRSLIEQNNRAASLPIAPPEILDARKAELVARNARLSAIADEVAKLESELMNPAAVAF